MQLVSCLTPRSSALRSLRGFTDPTTRDHLKEFEVSRRVDRKHAMRYKLQEVRRTLAKRKSGRGICGSSCSLSFRFCLFVVLVDYKEPLCFLMSFSRERLRRVLRKKEAVILHLHTFTPADLDLHTFTPADLDLHTLTSADLDLHTLTSADLDLHTLTSADLHLHTFTPADLDLHTFTPADLDLHTLTSADLDLHTLKPADLDLHTLTPADLDLHILTPADLDLHTLTPADLHHHTLTPADLDLHTLTPADLDLHTFTSADLLSLFFYSLLRRGRCRRSATKRNPFARNGRWTSKT